MAFPNDYQRGGFGRKERRTRNTVAQPQTTTPEPAQPEPPSSPLEAYFPNSPFFEAGRRSLTDQYRATLAEINAQRGNLQPQYDLQMARLGTNQGIDWRDLQSNLADRGIYNSGITTTARNQMETGYGRQRQDLTSALQQQLGYFTRQQSQAELSYQQGLMELLLQAAAQMAGDPSWALPYGSYSSTAGAPDYSGFFNPNA